VVEPLEKRRQPYPTLEAVYLMAPTADGIQRIIDDFTRGKFNPDGRLYAAAHLFFTSSLDDRLFFKLKSSPASQYVKTLKEIFIDFLALESQCFLIDRPYSLISFFGTEVSGEVRFVESIDRINWRRSK
jgi:syntaxin-binding protein 1